MIPDFSSHPNRLFIKSVICANWSDPDFPKSTIKGFVLNPSRLIIQVQGGPNKIYDAEGRTLGYYRS